MTDLRKAQFLEILKRYRTGNASQEEIDFIDAYYNSFETKPGLLRKLSDPQREALKNSIRETLHQKIITCEKTDRAERRIKRLRYAAAAAVLLAFGVGLQLYLHKRINSNTEKIVVHPDDIIPGGNKAVLTLADGSTIILDSTLRGEIANERGTRIVKSADGQLTYAASDRPGHKNYLNKPGYNTIITPRGGQYQVILPDSTKVWLNASSSLRYPSRFTGDERKVTLSGEAYFEVAENKAMPFRVISKGQEVEVVGTRFNINSYKDEASIKTTLLEGSVKVMPVTGSGRKTTYSRLLTPGQEASLDHTGVVRIADANLQYAIAWKNGKFVFDKDPIESIMRKIARWYDVEIVYGGNMENKDFSGSISRFADVSDVLQKLELTGIIHFKIERRQIIVMP